MGFYSKGNVFSRISVIEILKFYCGSIIWGLWIVAKAILKRLWKKRENTSIQRNPPTCLTDSSLGKHLYIKLKRVKLHYVEAGDKNDDLILLLHGFPDCWLTWRYQIPELSKYFRVVAVDLKGFGDSDKPESRSGYGIQILIEELRELVFSLGHKSCIIVGHDIGGLLGWFLVHLYPDFVEKFVSLASPHPNLYWNSIPNTSQFNNRWVQFCQLPLLPERNALEEDLEVIDRCYDHLTPNAVSRTYLDAYKYAFSRAEDWTGAINYFRNLPFWRLNCGNEENFVPCLLVVGNRDKSVHIESIIASTDYAEKNSLKVVDGASHHLHQQRPNEVNKLLINFLVGAPAPKLETKTSSNGLVNRMFEAVSSTVKYGNNVLDVMQKKTNGITSRALYLGQNST